LGRNRSVGISIIVFAYIASEQKKSAQDNTWALKQKLGEIFVYDLKLCVFEI
jgi:hypothetical protein